MKAIIAQNFNHIAKLYDSAAVLHQAMGARLFERLELFKISPETILDLGGGTGNFASAISLKYPKATLINLDISENMLRISKRKAKEIPLSLLCADGEYAPLKSQSIDFVFSNGFLQYFSYPQNILQEIYRVLKPEGIFLFTTFGPNTLKELRDTYQKMNLPYPIQYFSEMHDLGDLLIKTGFIDPVMDTETLTLTYNTVEKLLDDLQHTECHTISPTKALTKTYENLHESQTVLPATFEIIYGLGFRASKSNHFSKDENGLIKIAADDIPILSNP